MVTKVQLANMALDHLGSDNIASLNEASTAARKVNSRIDGCIDAVLEMSDWTFARKVANLAERPTTDWPERYGRMYDLPSDMLKAVRLVPVVDVPNTPPIEYAIGNGALYTDEPDARLQYTYRMVDLSRWPQSFTEAVAAYIARTIATPLTRKRQMFVDANALFTQLFGAAVEYDAAQEPTKWAYPSEYLNARGGTSASWDGRGADGSGYWGN